MVNRSGTCLVGYLLPVSGLSLQKALEGLLLVGFKISTFSINFPDWDLVKQCFIKIRHIYLQITLSFPNT